MSDPVEEARRVLADWTRPTNDLHADQRLESSRYDALANLLSHVERPVDDRDVEEAIERLLTPGYEPNRLGKETASLLRNLWNRVTATERYLARLTAPVTGDRADAAADIRHLMLYEDPRSEDHAILEKAAALLESHARREVALAEAIRALNPQNEPADQWECGWDAAVKAVLRILAEVADGGER